MAVLIEALCLVIRIDSIRAKYQGGWEQFVVDEAGLAYCFDEELVSICFTSETEVVDHIKLLEAKGLTYLEDGQAVDMCLMDQLRGPLNKASWAEYGHVSLDDAFTQSLKACRFKGSETRTVMLPERWEYKGSYSDLLFNCGMLSYNKDDALKSACNVVSRGYNRMNPGFIALLMTDDPIFSSEQDSVEIRGNNDVFRYFVGKFASMQCGKPRNYTELATYREEYCLIVCEGSKDNPVAVLRIEMSDGFITSMRICKAPHYSECERLGIFPGLVDAGEDRIDQSRELDHQPQEQKKTKRRLAKRDFRESTASSP